MKITKIAFILFLMLPLLANKCKKEADEGTKSDNDSKTEVAEGSTEELTDLMEQAYGETWLNLYEKDTDDAKAYQVSTAEFPPARGRYGFKLDKKGNFWEVGPGPTDIPTKTKGTWEWKEKGESILVKVEDRSYVLEMLFYADGLLMIKKSDVEK